MAKQTPMDREAADRIARAAQENPESKTAQDDRDAPPENR